MLSSAPPIEPEIRKNLKYNFTICLLDGGFFGFAIGFGSFVTIIPLFVSNFTDSALLIGLIPAIHNIGWLLPQLFTAGWVARLRRYKPVVMLLTIHERIPFLGLALVAWFAPKLSVGVILGLTYFFLIWQSLGGGLTANAWMSMIAKIIPPNLRGTFFGAQASAANALAALSAILAGLMLEKMDSPLDYALCFLCVGIFMGVSYFFLSRTREPEDLQKIIPENLSYFWKRGLGLLRSNHNFLAFLAARVMSQISLMGIAFYIVYGLRHFGMDEVTAGIITSAYMAAQIVANPLMGRLGDRWSHRSALQIGALAATLSAFLAWAAPSIEWFYLVFILAAIANVAAWTTAIAMTINFSNDESDRPLYIGFSNTLTAPAAILAPLLGGWLADSLGFGTMFLASALGGLLTMGVLHFFVKDPESLELPA